MSEAVMPYVFRARLYAILWLIIPGFMVGEFCGSPLYVFFFYSAPTPTWSVLCSVLFSVFVFSSSLSPCLFCDRECLVCGASFVCSGFLG